MLNDKVVDKIRKLLRLAESADVNEAAAAAGAAQRLMEEHRIDQAMISLDDDESDGTPDEEDIRSWADEPLESSGRLPGWKSQLAVAIAGVNGCQVFLGRAYKGDDYDHPQTTLCLVGRPSDVASVRYLFAYLTKEIDRLCKLHGRGLGRTWANSFRVGAVHTVRKRLKQAQEKARLDARSKLKGKGTTALAKLDLALARVDKRALEAEAWMKEHLKLTSARSSRTRRDWDAYAAGKRAGGSIDLSGPTGGRRGSRALGPGDE
jgi:hypothetical protein